MYAKTNLWCPHLEQDEKARSVCGPFSEMFTLAKIKCSDISYKTIWTNRKENEMRPRSFEIGFSRRRLQLHQYSRPVTCHSSRPPISTERDCAAGKRRRLPPSGRDGASGRHLLTLCLWPAPVLAGGGDPGWRQVGGEGRDRWER